MIVLDKSFWKNSYVNLTNAFVVRPDIHYYSNVLEHRLNLWNLQIDLDCMGREHGYDKNTNDHENGYMLFMARKIKW